MFLEPFWMKWIFLKHQLTLTVYFRKGPLKPYIVHSIKGLFSTRGFEKKSAEKPKKSEWCSLNTASSLCMSHSWKQSFPDKGLAWFSFVCQELPFSPRQVQAGKQDIFKIKKSFRHILNATIIHVEMAWYYIMPFRHGDPFRFKIFSQQMFVYKYP